MALSMRFVVSSTSSLTSASHLDLPVLCRETFASKGSLGLQFKSMRIRRPRRPIHAIEKEEEQETTVSEMESSSGGTGDAKPSEGAEMTEMASEIKEAMQARREREEGNGGDLWRGVAEEIREIEWPAFGKVVGTTGVVLGVIAGSSIVLLTLNAILAELSDRVFAGRGVQDFFS
ncbi:preprotein translocase subunit SECE1 [Macadamia integrifolia]|uniref:preprotein translocase subunit SECE1 n=1 Tax=Macadamia integrifolia TaxID=60698 RepID=UPI001C4EC3AF|nr:preprotein translocase subunit SECE1 [Macadamia integrifolia]XP_042490323.1 preprotein translocase subunit SECE1 [Macadamia integrifolia]